MFKLFNNYEMMMDNLKEFHQMEGNDNYTLEQLQDIVENFKKNAFNALNKIVFK